ncbi:MAG: ACT domain-containing protein, partial [Tomitella sp.]|nr:ACT domain-containing protein [Tomitella sp.]
LRIGPMGDTPTRYHVCMEVTDRVGVLSAVAAEFAHHDVSISIVQQEDTDTGASLVVVTHMAVESALRDTVAAVEELPYVNAVTSVLRMEGTGE